MQSRAKRPAGRLPCCMFIFSLLKSRFFSTSVRDPSKNLRGLRRKATHIFAVNRDSISSGSSYNGGSGWDVCNSEGKQRLPVENYQKKPLSFSMEVQHHSGFFFLRENPFNLPVFVVLLGILKAWASVIVGPLYPQNPVSLCPRRVDLKLQCQTKLNPIGTVVCSSLSRCLITSRRLCI